MSTVQSPAGPDARLDVDLLAGVRVVELGAFVAVPFAGHLMARLGARVTRAEPSNVDPAHRLPGGACVIVALSDEHAARAVRARLPARWTGYVVRGLNRSPLWSRVTDR